MGQSSVGAFAFWPYQTTFWRTAWLRWLDVTDETELRIAVTEYSCPHYVTISH